MLDSAIQWLSHCPWHECCQNYWIIGRIGQLLDFWRTFVFVAEQGCKWCCESWNDFATNVARLCNRVIVEIPSKCAFLLQVENKREQLLSHPLVTFLLHYKWQKFGRYIYYFKLALFCIFLFFLTGYTIYSTQLNKLSKKVLNKSSFPYVWWIDIGRFVILALASWHIASEVSDLCVISFYFGLHYSAESILQWVDCVLASSNFHSCPVQPQVTFDTRVTHNPLWWKQWGALVMTSL